MDSGRWSPKPGESSHLMEAREIEQLLRTLHQSWEEGELKQALKRVEELFPSGTYSQRKKKYKKPMNT